MKEETQVEGLTALIIDVRDQAATRAETKLPAAQVLSGLTGLTAEVGAEAVAAAAATATIDAEAKARPCNIA